MKLIDFVKKRQKNRKGLIITCILLILIFLLNIWFLIWNGIQFTDTTYIFSENVTIRSIEYFLHVLWFLLLLTLMATQLRLFAYTLEVLLKIKNLSTPNKEFRKATKFDLEIGNTLYLPSDTEIYPVRIKKVLYPINKPEIFIGEDGGKYTLDGFYVFD